MISKLNNINAAFKGIIPLNSGKCIVTKNGIPAYGIERFSDNPKEDRFHIYPAGLPHNFILKNAGEPSIENVAKSVENGSWEE